MPADNQPDTESLLRRFCQMHGEGGVIFLRAPARINILGEHVDYVSYLPAASLPFGSHEHAMTMLVRPNDDGKVRGASMNESFAPFELSLRETQPPGCSEKSWEGFVLYRPVPAPHWSNYVAGAVSFAQWKFGERIKRGFDFLIDSTIPANSGASSSSALVVLAGAAIRQANQIEFSLEELAQDSSQAEWFLGTRGGSLDQTAICLAKRHHAVHLTFADNRAEVVPLPSERFRWLTFFTHAANKSSEVMLEYNERAAVSRLVIPALIQGWEFSAPHSFIDWRYGVALLRDGASKTPETLRALLHQLPETMSLDELRELYPRTFQQCETLFPALVSERLTQPLKIRSRALHHLDEIWRVKEAVDVLRTASSEESAMRKIGELINQTHASLRDLYDVSTPQVEQLVELLRADSLVYGARLMGGGFGGNVLALTTVEHAAPLVDRIQQEFYASQNRDSISEGAVMISTPGEGLSQIND
ncbi:MAG: galactokinase [Blastocatellia bacterium]